MVLVVVKFATPKSQKAKRSCHKTKADSHKHKSVLTQTYKQVNLQETTRGRPQTMRNNNSSDNGISSETLNITDKQESTQYRTNRNPS